MFMSLGASVKQPKGVLEELDCTTIGLCVQCHQQVFMFLRSKLLGFDCSSTKQLGWVVLVDTVEITDGQIKFWQ